MHHPGDAGRRFDFFSDQTVDIDPVRRRRAAASHGSFSPRSVHAFVSREGAGLLDLPDVLPDRDPCRQTFFRGHVLPEFKVPLPGLFERRCAVGDDSLLSSGRSFLDSQGGFPPTPRALQNRAKRSCRTPTPRSSANKMACLREAGLPPVPAVGTCPGDSICGSSMPRRKRHVYSMRPFSRVTFRNRSWPPSSVNSWTAVLNPGFRTSSLWRPQESPVIFTSRSNSAACLNCPST
jgi:hypothetical protein